MTSRILMLIVFGFLFTPKLYSQQKGWSNQDSCYSYLEVYSKYWKMDSLGKNGFRQLMADCVFDKCLHFEGEKWAKVYKYLGRPNHKFTLEGTTFFRYRLNYQGRKINIVGALLLDIGVGKSGLIESFSVYVIDG